MGATAPELVTILLYSAFFTYAAVYYFNRKLHKYGYLVNDMYKKHKAKMPTMGGIPMFVGVMVSLALTQLMVRDDVVGKLFIFYFIITVYTLYGVVDDLLSFKQRYDKILILYVLSLPIVSLIDHQTITILGHEMFFDGFLPLLIAPAYIMVTANLINVHSGFNGQATGLTLIMLILAGVKSYMLYGITNLIYLFPVLGALIVIYTYNFYPAKIHEGNSGAFMMGATLGAFLIINKLEWFGFVMLIPHTINFIMDTIVLFILKKPDVKFGTVRTDGTIEAPKTMRFKSLKFMLTYYLRLKEWQAVILLYIPTIICGLVAVLYL